MGSSVQTHTSVNSSSNSSLGDPQSLRVCRSLFAALLLFFLLVLLPLFIHVLYVGYRRWRKRRSNAVAETTSHSDVFTYNMVALELVALTGFFFYCNSIFAQQLDLRRVGFHIFSIVTPGHSLSHVLTCVERYVAVAHPVTYLGLKRSAGVRIRNISVGGVWMICFSTFSVKHRMWFSLVLNLSVLLASSVVVLFCSLSVLHILIHPGPRDVGQNRERVDQTRQRAFNTIIAITGALLLRFCSVVVFAVLSLLSVVNFNDDCVFVLSTTWLSLPSSLVLPLLFLHRAGKLRGCKKRSRPG